MPVLPSICGGYASVRFGYFGYRFYYKKPSYDPQNPIEIDALELEYTLPATQGKTYTFHFDPQWTIEVVVVEVHDAYVVLLARAPRRV